MNDPIPNNSPKLALCDVEETIAFRAIDKILRNDAKLNRIVLYYQSWSDDSFDGISPNEYTCPFVSIAPKPMPGKWESEGQQRLPLSVGITLATAGTDADQIMNLWCLIRRALWPKDPVRYAANRTAMSNAGIVKATLALGAFGALFPKVKVKKGFFPPVILMAQGELNLLLLISTP